MIIMLDVDLDKVVDVLIGVGYGVVGECCMVILVVVFVGQEIVDCLIEKLVLCIEKLKVGLYIVGDDIDYGFVIMVVVKQCIEGLIDSGVEQGVMLVKDGCGMLFQGYENGFFVGLLLFDNVIEDMDIYKEEIFGFVLLIVCKDIYEDVL